MHSHAYFHKDSSALIKTGPGLLSGAALEVGPSPLTLTLYDNTAASGAIIARWRSAGTTNLTTTFTLPHPVAFARGLYASFSGSDGGYCVFYE